MLVQGRKFVSTVNQLITEALDMKTNVSPLKTDETRSFSLRREDGKMSDKNEVIDW